MCSTLTFRLVAFLLLATGCGSVASAADTARPELARLGNLTPTERAVLDPLLARGVVTLVEFSDDAALPGILVALRVRARPSVVARVVDHPGEYARFMDALSSVEVRQQTATDIAYDWEWHASIFTLRGTNVLNPSEIRGDGAFRAAGEALRGDLGAGRFVWRGYPDRGGEGTILVLAMRVDLREANYITRELARAGRTVNRSLNLALCHMMAIGVAREAERQSGVTDEPTAVPAFPASAADIADGALPLPEIDSNALMPLLVRGDLVVVERSRSNTKHVIVIGRTGVGPERVVPVMMRPEGFGAALIEGSHVTVTSRTENNVEFDWAVNLPIIGSGGHMVLRSEQGIAHFIGRTGSLGHARWRFDVPVLPHGEAVVMASGEFDPGEVSWIVGQVVRARPDLTAGLAGATQLMFVRSLRAEALDPSPQ